MTDLTRARFAPVDWSLLALYLLFLLVIGFWPRRKDTESYLIADRSLSLPVFVATLVATWYGGILGAGEFAYNYGLVGWTTNGLPYYVFAICFALFLARRVRGGASHLYTIPDKLAAEYDRKTALLGALFAFIYASPSTYVLMAGTLLHLLFGWPLVWAMVVGILFSVVYVFRGGFLSDVRVNTLQFLLMFTGFVVAAWLCLAHWGGLHTLTAPGRLPPTHLKLLGDQTFAYAVVWFFIALTTLTDPGFHQRCYAARTPMIAVFGILAAVCCWFTFDILTSITGLFARALIPGLTDGKMAFPALAERIMPPGFKGLFYVGMLAPVMASIVSYTFISAMTVGRDFIWRLRAEPDNANVPRYTQIGLLATSVLAILVAYEIPSVVQQWYAFGNVFVPGMLIPLLGAYAHDERWKAPSDYAFASMLAGAGLAFGWLWWGWHHGGYDDPQFPLNWQPMYPGLLICAVIYSCGLIRQYGVGSGQ
jgi:SSS family solute:Na+ symporter